MIFRKLNKKSNSYTRINTVAKSFNHPNSGNHQKCHENLTIMNLIRIQNFSSKPRHNKVQQFFFIKEQ